MVYKVSGPHLYSNGETTSTKATRKKKQKRDEDEPEDGKQLPNLNASQAAASTMRDDAASTVEDRLNSPVGKKCVCD